MRYPRVVIVSNNCFSESSSNGRTLGNFFLNWDKDCLAQFYIQAEFPNSDVCKNFYRVTDYEMLHAILKFKRYGRVLKKNEIILGTNNPRTDKGLEKKINSSRVKKKPYMYILRNLLWYTNRWKTEKLNNWISNFQPEVVLFQAGDSAFMCDIAREISVKNRIPLIIYNSEDYYLKDRKSFSPLFYIQRSMLKRSFKKLMDQTKYVIYSCDSLKNDFDKIFKISSKAILTVSSITPSYKKKNNDIPVISYLGNIGIERWKSIVKVGKTLQSINSDYFVDVYTQNIIPEAKAVFILQNGIRFKGSVSYNEVINIMQLSDLLLHVENFSDFIKWDLKHAFSTKIADSLSCGTCLFAYGPEEIASIKYLKENDAACVVTEKENLEITLRKIISDKSLRKKFIEKALRLAQKRHNSETNSRRFEAIICDVVDNSKMMEE